MRILIIYFIKAYQFAISPFLAPNCRFIPSCSEFACESIERYGISKGLMLAFRRILKCHPFSRGGYDPVPEISFENRSMFNEVKKYFKNNFIFFR